jgi:hypothetical protein
VSETPEPKSPTASQDIERTCGDLIDTALRGLRDQQRGRLMMAYALKEDGDRWVAGMEFGSEGEGSEMYGGAAYGTGSTAREALTSALQDAGWVQ